MTSKIHLPNLTSREAVADAIHRIALGIDTNDHALFASACVQDPSMLLTAGPVTPSGWKSMTLSGWESINGYFQRVFGLVTSHVLSNIRIELADDNAETAHLTTTGLTHHMRPDDALDKQDASYTCSCQYNVDLIKDGSDGLWKIKKWEVKVIWTTGDPTILHGQG
ncbi:hypothetical protein CC86DRAFT_419585 [Ophiobolus disseminans]|uniref:SnoaL-like domain-containing protein n=1 Tax=Ophiobolus disseminans TaxID=1469910 RepID=A0A6A6ZWU7_9PLEO|nr:hypothetical protein CC86DRAFT_419585 [Ophiobolus disseminans]